MNINLETTPCVFSHPKIENLFYCSNHPQGMTQNISMADRFVGAKQRMDGLKKVQERFSQLKEGSLIFTYIVS